MDEIERVREMDEVNGNMDDIKLHLMLRITSWFLGGCGVPFHYLYSQVHSDPEC